jgi:hypothetical protein
VICALLLLVLKALAWAALSLYALWFLYLAVMALKRADDADLVSSGVLSLAFPGVLLAYVLDVLINWVILSVLLVEWPRELTVTYRLSRHLRKPDASRLGRWRTAIARWVCTQLLDKFDPSGTHCKCKGCEPAK